LLGTVALGIAIYFSARLLRDPSKAPVARHAGAPQPDWSGDFPGHISQLTAILQKLELPVPLPAPVEEQQGAGKLRWVHRRYDLEIPKPVDIEQFDKLLEPLRNTPAGVIVHETDDSAGKQIAIGIDGLLTHTLIFRWLTRPPRIAIVIDDLGDDLAMARDLVALPAPLTLAVMPFRTFSGAVAERAQLAGREVLLDLPMNVEPGHDPNTVANRRADADRETLVRAIDDSLAALPQAIGVSHQPGSAFATDQQRLHWTLERLKEKNVFFFEGLTEAHGTACAAAHEVHLACASATLLLDDSDGEHGVREQLQSLRALARARGEAVVVGHARATVLAALRGELADFAQQGIDIVPVSALTSPPSLSRR
jgi:hypothetical protein